MCNCDSDLRSAFHSLECLDCGSPLCPSCAISLESTTYCGACAAQHETWRSVCESCGAFGTLQWRAPGTFGHVLPPETRAELEFAGNDKK